VKLTWWATAGFEIKLEDATLLIDPYLSAKRMTALSARLTAEVFPFVPLRHWVLSFPVYLKYALAYDRDLYGQAIALFDRRVSAFYREQAERQGIRQPLTGSLHVEQLAGSSANLNPHSHSIFFNGVFYQTSEDPHSSLRFRPADPLCDQDLGFIISLLRADLLDLVVRRGLLSSDLDSDKLSEQEPLLSACLQASAQNTLALGPRAGKSPLALGAEPFANRSRRQAQTRGPLHVHYDGLDLHAAQLIDADDRQQLERVLRYVLRPPLSEQRLSLLPDGRVRPELKKKWSNGVGALVFSPSEFIERLASLVPRPHVGPHFLS